MRGGSESDIKVTRARMTATWRSRPRLLGRLSAAAAYRGATESEGSGGTHRRLFYVQKRSQSPNVLLNEFTISIKLFSKERKKKPGREGRERRGEREWR